MKGMILAAGLGTRLKPFTNKHPKALAEINGKTLLQRNIEYLRSFGITDVIVNVHHFANQIIEALQSNHGFGSNISISDERNLLLDTGGGLLHAKDFFETQSEPFVVMNVDIMTDLNLQEMTQQHLTQNPIATLAVTNRNTSRYFLFDEEKQLCGWENVQMNDRKIVRDASSGERKAFSGIQVLDSSIFSEINFTGKFSIVDAYLDLAVNHIITYFDHSGSLFIDAGKPENIVQAEKLFP